MKFKDGVLTFGLRDECIMGKEIWSRAREYITSEVKKVIIPNKVTTIGGWAFEGCTGLTSIEIPGSVTTIGWCAFYGCTGLTSIEIPDGVTSIGACAFRECTSLTSIEIPDSVRTLGDGVFKNCIGLTSIKIPKLVKKIKKESFAGCSNLQGIVFPDGLTKIEDCAFEDCCSLKHIVFPKKFRSLGQEAFSGCSDLESVLGLDKVDWHRKKCFTGTRWMETQAENGFGYAIFDGYLEVYQGKENRLIIPDEVSVIGCSAFEGNSSIVDVIIPEGVTTIEESAFASCTNLKSIQIAESVTRIEDYAFYNDAKLVIRCYRGSEADSYRKQFNIPVEYISKAKIATPPEWKETRSVEKSIERPMAIPPEQPMLQENRNTAYDGLAGLSEEERQVIMKMRRDKAAKKRLAAESSTSVGTATKTAPVRVAGEPKSVEYTLITNDERRIELTLLDDKRKISNNIFTLRFEQSDGSDSGKLVAEYEIFVIDSTGQTVSNVKTIVTDKSGEDLIHKVTLSLSGQTTFDKEATYYVLVRSKGESANVISKIPYQIHIEFVSDFGF